ncbi:MAG: hypothetical protein H6608_12020 [Flavobacteriales bacterium]|nr:hypothetical protein [Bacteroidota bacterium]MCB9241856.1 hypothetical protein [Flavobacteriales bacterium]
MKQILIVFVALVGFASLEASGAEIQPPDSSRKDTTTYDVVIKNDGVEFTGHIVSQDAREVVIETKNMGLVAIPKHEIKTIKKVKASEIDKASGRLLNDRFASRYFLTANGLPIEKGESYVQWTLAGPDIEFAVGKRFGVGVMTSWLGVPLIGSAKYSFPVSKNFNIGVGALVGSMTWTNITQGGVLPYTSLTLGNRQRNLNFSVGHATLFSEGTTEGSGLYSIAAMTSMGPKVSFVFDSFILPSNGLFIAAPCIRWSTKPNKAIQFGLGAFARKGEFFPLPIPAIQWFQTIN